MPDMNGWTQLLARTYAILREPVLLLDEPASARPTPCSEWSARDLFEHTVWAIGMFATGAGAAAEEAPLTGTPAERFDAAVARNLAAWRSVSDPAKIVALGFGEFPATMAAAQNQLDSLVHGWDLAAALGLPAFLPDDLATAALQTATARFQARPRGQWFDPALPPRDQTAQERLLALTGRDTSRWVTARRSAAVPTSGR